MGDTYHGIFSSGGESNTLGGISLYFRRQIYLHFTKKNRLVVEQWSILSSISGRGDQWLHVAGTWKQNGAAKLYIDGALVHVVLGPDATASSLSPNEQGEMQVGRLISGHYYGEFTLDEWYVWDTELTWDQVKHVYEAYKTGKHTLHNNKMHGRRG